MILFFFIQYVFIGEGFLSFNKETGHFVSKSWIFSDALLIDRAAFLLRHEMLKCKTKFEGHFQQDFVNNCVPNQLIHFFESCLTGIKVGSEDLKPSKEEHTLAQLCQFNCHQSYKKDALFHRHSP